MKKVLLLVLVSMLFSAHARSDDPEWYIGLGIAATKLDAGDVDFTASNGTAFTGDLGGNANGWHVFCGIDFTEHFGFEAKYSDSGEAKSTLAVFDPIFGISSSEARASIDGFTVYDTGNISFTQSLSGMGKLGYTSQDFSLAIRSASSAIREDGLAFGVGLRYRFKKWALGGEIEYWDIDLGRFDEPLRFTLNIEHHFGTKNRQEHASKIESRPVSPRLVSSLSP